MGVDVGLFNRGDRQVSGRQAGWRDGADALLRQAEETGAFDELVRRVDTAASDVLTQFASEAAQVSVRSADPELLRRALLALALASVDSADFRDQLLVAAPVWHSCGLLGLDARAEFEAVAGKVRHSACREFVDDWLSRPPGEQSLAVMGYRSGYGVDGFCYIEVLDAPDPPYLPRPAETLTTPLLPAELFTVFDAGVIAQPENQRLPSPLDQAIIELLDRAHGDRKPNVEKWLSEDWTYYLPVQQELGRLARTIGYAESDRLADFALRMATHAARSRDPRVLYHAEIALAIAAARPWNPKELPPRLAAVWYTHLLLGVDEMEFRLAGGMVGQPPVSSTFLLDWLTLPPRSRELGNFDWQVVEGTDGISFKDGL